MDHIVLEVGLALALIAAAALISMRLRFSVVPFLILAGMAVGPHAPKIGPFDFRFIESAPLIEFMEKMVVAKTISPEDLKLFLVTDSVDEAMAHIEKFGLKRRPVVKPSVLLGERDTGKLKQPQTGGITS